MVQVAKIILAIPLVVRSLEKYLLYSEQLLALNGALTAVKNAKLILLKLS